MKGSSALAFAALFAAAGADGLAHPGVGIVMDRAGNVFYTDLEQVWKISPDGRRSVAVANVHTHELYLDAAGFLYGEHTWYSGEATNRWGYRVWRRSPGGRVVDVVPARDGFRTDYSFVRDAAGNQYWVDGGARKTFHRRDRAGRVSVVAECGDCRDVRWMTAAPEGTIYFTDGTDLREVSPAGRIRTVARRVGRRILTQPQAGERHIVMGLWLDRAGNVYAAVYGAREVKRISPEGRVGVVARSRFPWSPTGGMIAPNGDLWVLETSATNAVRVRRIPGIGPARTGCRELLDGTTGAVRPRSRASSPRRGVREGSGPRRRPSPSLVYLNHLVPAFRSWLAARAALPPREYEIASIIRRARAHRERVRATLGSPE